MWMRTILTEHSTFFDQVRYDTRLSDVVILSVNVDYAVIQGTADVGKKLSEDELEKTMDFCRREYSILFIYS